MEQPAPKPFPQWQYTVLYFSPNESASNKLDEYGLKGWELVSAISLYPESQLKPPQIRCFLKRRLP